MTVLPKDHEVFFLLAEDMRPDLGNKMSLLGVFLGGDIGLPPATVFPAILQSLTLIFLITEGEGEMKHSAFVDGPDGRLADFDFGTLVKKRSDRAVIAFKVAPFFIEKFGTYKVTLKLENRSYARTIAVHPMDIFG